MTSNKHININLFHSLCKEYNLSIVLQNSCVIHACMPSKYVIPGSYMLEYNIFKDALYMPVNMDRDNKTIFFFSVTQFSPKLFKLMCMKFIRLEKELKELEIQQRQDRLQSDF